MSEGRQQTYYHYKDIRFLAHEPLLEKFRSISAYMKKVNKVAHKGAVDLARRMYARRPEYTLDHLVRERYPRFQDAVADLDDALCMAHLYATLPGDKRYVEPAVTAKAALLCKQWALWVSRTRSLRKVFLTIKGVYYQASVCGQDVTWLVPYKFVQGLPDDVDFPVMNTFMEFYDVMLRFTMFKLYHDIGLQFPPPEVAAAADAGAFLGALHPQALGTQNSTGVPASTAVTPVSAGGAAADAVPLDRSVARAAAAAAAGAGGNAGDEGGSDDSDGESEEGGDGPAGGDEEGEDITLLETFGKADGEEGDAAATALASARAATAATKKFQRLFEGLVFFAGRETPLEPLELLVTSFGGRLGWEGPGSPLEVDDTRITHQICDRPKVRGTPFASREYVQPQWVFDSINARMCLPTGRYAPGKVLPPHLSPFVDDAREGYIPAYRQELDALVAAAEGRAVAGSDGGAEGGPTPAEEAQHAAELAAEAAGAPRAVEALDSDDDSDGSGGEGGVSGGSAVRASRQGLGKLGKAPNKFADRSKLRGGVAGMLGNSQAPLTAEQLQGLQVGADGLVAEAADASEKRELAASMLSRKKRRQYDVVQKSLRRSENHRMRLAAKRQRVQEQGEEAIMAAEDETPKRSSKTRRGAAAADAGQAASQKAGRTKKTRSKQRK